MLCLGPDLRGCGGLPEVSRVTTLRHLFDEILFGLTPFPIRWES